MERVHSVQVWAHLKRTFGYQLESVTIQKEGIEIKLTGEEWAEIEATLKGRRYKLGTKPGEGEYESDELILFNTKSKTEKISS